MYQKKSERLQTRIEDFMMPFGGHLSAENRWVKLAQLMPWDMIEEIYAKKFKNEKSDGRPAIQARIAFGALHIQASECFTDEKTLENISENPYLQYFLGIHSFETQPLFDASMMTHFRKRFTAQDIAAINEELYRRTHLPKGTPSNEGGNGGILVLDATAAPADVRYPTDLSLQNECRENVERSLSDLNVLLATCKENPLSKRQKKRLEVIHQVAAQQREHVENPTKPIADRIVNLRQPHVRPIVRGKAGHPVEFGQKLAFPW